MSFHITSGTLGQAMAPLLFAPFAQRFGLRATPLLMLPALAVLAASCCGASRRSSGCRSRTSGGGFRALRPYAKPLTLLYLIVVLRTLTAHELLDVRAGDADAARHVASPRRAPRRRSTCSPSAPADSSADRSRIASARGASSSCRWWPRCRFWRSRRCSRAGRSSSCSRRRIPAAVDAAGQRHFRQMIAPISAATVSSLMMGFAWGIGGLACRLSACWPIASESNGR